MSASLLLDDWFPGGDPAARGRFAPALAEWVASVAVTQPPIGSFPLACCIDPMNKPESRPSFILIPGAGGMAWYWHRVVPLLEKAGFGVGAADLPGDDESAGLHEYAKITMRAIGRAQSSGSPVDSSNGRRSPFG